MGAMLFGFAFPSVRASKQGAWIREKHRAHGAHLPVRHCPESIAPMGRSYGQRNRISISTERPAGNAARIVQRQPSQQLSRLASA